MYTIPVLFLFSIGLRGCLHFLLLLWLTYLLKLPCCPVPLPHSNKDMTYISTVISMHLTRILIIMYSEIRTLVRSCCEYLIPSSLILFVQSAHMFICNIIYIYSSLMHLQPMYIADLHFGWNYQFSTQYPKSYISLYPFIALNMTYCWASSYACFLARFICKRFIFKRPCSNWLSRTYLQYKFNVN